MAVYKEINRADGSGVTTFYRISDILDTVETDDQEGQAVIIDYNQAQNKPSINGVALVGNKTSEDLGLQPAGDYITNDEADEKFIDEDELEAKNYVNQAELQDAIAHIEHFHREIVEALPLTGMDNVLYMVRKGGTGEDIYNEYIWVGLSNSEDGYEFLGTTATDLTDYYTKTQVDTALAGKVDKDGNKGLSEQNYTLAEKTKLAGLENYDDTEIQADVAGLNTRVNNISTSSTALNNKVATLEPKVETNSAAVTTIYDLLDKRMTAIRLVEQGDGWVWMNLEGSRLTYAQASAALGHENCMLFIEQLENDGKVIPAEYKSEGDHINVIFKDLDSLVHVMTCGEDDALVTQEISTDGSYCSFTVEDDAIGYGTALDAIYGDTLQYATIGKNLYDDNYSHYTRPYDYFILDIALEQGATYQLSARKISDTTVRDCVVGIVPYGEKYADFSDVLKLVIDTGGNTTTKTLTIDSTWTAPKLVVYTPYSGAQAYFNNLFKSYQVQLEKSSEITDYEKFSGGTASPNPDYPQNIRTVTGNITVNVTKKNLLNLTLNSQNINGIDITKNDDGSYIIDGTCTGNFDIHWSGPQFLKAGTYYVGLGTTTNQFNFYYRVNDINYVIDSPIRQSYFTLTLTEDTWIQRFSSWVTTGKSLSNQTFYPMITKELPFDFEPYVVQTYPLALGSIELCKIGDYQNKIYKQNDAWYLHKDIDKIVLNGQDGVGNTYVSLGNGHGGQKRFKVGNSLFGNVPNNIRTVYADYYQGIPYNGSTTTSNSICQWSDQNMFAITTDSTTMTMSDFKSMLNSKPLTVYYVLENPTDTEIDDPTLLAQLNALEQMTQFKSNYITIVPTGTNLASEADFTYIDNVVINNTDLILGKDTYWNDEVPTQQDLPANAQEGEIRIVQDTEAVYIYDGTDWIPFDKGTEVDLSNYLAKDNTTAWIPTGAFNPATKKYVDDSVGGIHVPTKTSQLQNDSNFINKNANDLTNYYPKSNTYTRAEVDALIHSGGTGVQVVVVGDTLVITTVLPGGE